MTRLSLLSVLCCLSALAACGPTNAPLPDAGVEADAGTAADASVPPCTLAVTDPEGVEVTELSLGAGTRRTLQTRGEGWTSVELSLPSGWRGSWAERELELVAPYETGPAAEALVVHAACGDGQTTRAEVALSAQPARFSSITPWIPGDSGPLGREYCSMWTDPRAPDLLWVFGGFHYQPQQFTPAQDVWSLDLTTEAWTQHPDGPPEGLPGAALAVHPDGYLLRYGGLNLGQLQTNEQTPFVLQRVDTGTAGLTFEDLSPAMPPTSGDYQPSFFFHPGTDRFYAVCGLNERVGSHCKVHSYSPDTGAWTEEEVMGEVPPGRNGHFWTYDPKTDRLVIFSGEGWPQSAGCDNCLHDTWALEMSEAPLRWTRLAEDAPAIGRRNGSFALDPINHRFLVWGGTNDGRTAFPGLFALDLTRGEEAWHEVPTEGDAPPRSSGFAVFDRSRRRILVGFGNGARVYTDLWAIDL